MAHLLVTNDFPPKIGGIQSYLWELWRRLPAGDASVFTTPYAGTAEFDAAFTVEQGKLRWPDFGFEWAGLSAEELRGPHMAGYGWTYGWRPAIKESGFIAGYGWTYG